MVVLLAHIAAYSDNENDHMAFFLTKLCYPDVCYPDDIQKGTETLLITFCSDNCSDNNSKHNNISNDICNNSKLHLQQIMLIVSLFLIGIVILKDCNH